LELEAAYRSAQKSPKFRKELATHLRNFVGRPTPLMFARRLSEAIGRGRIYLKREDLCHTGAHKINNALGQVLLTQYLGKKARHRRNGRGTTRGSQPRRPPPSLGSRAMFTWVRKILSDRPECFSNAALGRPRHSRENWHAKL